MLNEKITKLLRWSEKYTKTDMVYLTRGGFWLSLGHIFQIITGFILLLAFANLLPKEAFGTYQFIISLAAIIASFTLTGIATALLQASAKDHRGVLKYAFKQQMIWNIAMVLVAGLIALYYLWKGNFTLGIAFLIVGACQPLITSFSLANLYLIGKEMFRQSTLLSVAQKLLPFVVVLSTLLFFKDVLIVVFAYFLSHTISYALIFIYTVKNYAPEYEENRDMMSYGKHVTAMNIIQDVAVNLDKVLLWKFLGAAPVAIYVLAYTPIIHLQSAFGLMRWLIFPKVAQKKIEELKSSLPQKIRRYFFLVLLVVAVYILAAPFIFKIFFPAYIESVVFSQVLALILLAVPRMLFGETLTAHKKTKELYVLNLSAPIIRIALLLILLPLFGIWGAIASVLLTEWYTAVLQWNLFRKIKS